MASENVVTLTDANFDEEVLKSDLPVLVDFWAVWCGPCRMIAPIIDELAGEYKGKLKVGKVDVDNNADVAARYRIQSIPTMKIFLKGEMVDSMVGALPKAQIVQRIAPHITGG